MVGPKCGLITNTQKGILGLNTVLKQTQRSRAKINGFVIYGTALSGILEGLSYNMGIGKRVIVDCNGVDLLTRNIPLMGLY